MAEEHECSYDKALSKAFSKGDISPKSYQELRDRHLASVERAKKKGKEYKHGAHQRPDDDEDDSPRKESDDSEQ